MPQNSINGIAFDKQGRLWVGTADGAAYYNGRTWTVVNMPNRQVSNNIYSLLAASDGSVWFGLFQGGIAKLKDDQWTHFSTSDGLPSDWVKCLLEDRYGRIWIATDKGVAVYFSGKWHNRSEGLPSPDTRRLLETERAGKWTLLASTARGVARLVEEDNKWVVEVDETQLPPLTDKPSVVPIAETYHQGKRSLWLGIRKSGLAEITEDGKVKLHTTSDGLADNTVHSLLVTNSAQGEQTLWAGTYNGLSRFWRGKWTSYGESHGLASTDIRSLAATSTEDGLMLLWLGTNSNGLVRMLLTTTSFDKSVGLSNNGVFSILETSDGAYWFGTYDGLTRYKEGVWTVYNQSSGLPGRIVSSLAEIDGYVWIGSSIGGLAKFDGHRFKTYNAENGLPSTVVLCIIRTSDGAVLAGTNEGVVRLENDRIKEHILEVLPNKYVTCLAESGKREKTLWVATRKGLARYNSGTWQTVTGLPNEHILSLMISEAEGEGEYLWVGTKGGLARALITDELRWEVLSDTTTPALPNNVIYKICQDRQGRIYVMTNKGVAVLIGNKTSKLTDYLIQTLNIENGLPSNECNQGAGFVDSKGRVWIGTISGAAAYDPALEVPNRKPPELHLERILVNGIPVKSLDSILEHDRNNISFEYFLGNYFRESENTFRTQLAGFESQPTPWTTSTRREYTNLPEGRYVFKLWGRDYLGNESAVLSIKFKIAPAPWRTWWAYAFYLLLLISSGYSAYRHRLRRLQQKQEERIALLMRLLNSTRVVNSQLDLQQVLEKIAYESASLIDGEPGGIGLIEGDKVVFKRIWKKDRWIDTRIEFELGQGIAGTVAKTGQPILVNDPKSDPRLAYPDLIEEYCVQGFIEVPIFDKAGKVVGVLEVRRRAGGPLLTETHRQLIESFAHHAAVAIENANLYGALEEKNLLVVESLREIERLYKNEQNVNKQLQQLDRMKSNFMAVTSHELRTPLTVLKGYLDALSEGYFGKLAVTQQKHIDVCLRMIDRLISTLNLILEMLKIEERKIILHRKPLDLQLLLSEIAQEMRPFAERRRQQLKLELCQTVIVEGDREKLSLVFLNLLQNAIKFTPDSGTIRVICKANDSFVEVIIEDEGIGLESDELEKIFDKFYTSEDSMTHSSGTYQFGARGVGLGLAVARSYVEAHGGKIRAESAGRGKGSSFFVILPALSEAPLGTVAERNRAREK
ncbi:MAG: two-component regulator propeller domain-containing protein [Acidobacteriota bacterium]|nr:ATP-binding protein [Blastocatellia bacterium]MDW8413548.1 two-component regulator propeller domain-containing protein [Acidobacteriota bacterium]